MVYKLGHVQPKLWSCESKTSSAFSKHQGIKILGVSKIRQKKKLESLLFYWGHVIISGTGDDGKMEANIRGSVFTTEKVITCPEARPSVLAPKAPLNRSSLTLCGGGKVKVPRGTFWQETSRAWKKGWRGMKYDITIYNMENQSLKNIPLITCGIYWIDVCFWWM